MLTFQLNKLRTTNYELRTTYYSFPGGARERTLFEADASRWARCPILEAEPPKASNFAPLAITS